MTNFNYSTDDTLREQHKMKVQQLTTIKFNMGLEKSNQMKHDPMRPIKLAKRKAEIAEIEQEMDRRGIKYTKG